MEHHDEAHYERADVDEVICGLEYDGVCGFDRSGVAFGLDADGPFCGAIGADERAERYGNSATDLFKASERHGRGGARRVG